MYFRTSRLKYCPVSSQSLRAPSVRSYLLNYVVVEQEGVPRAHMDPPAVTIMYVCHLTVAGSSDVPFTSSPLSLLARATPLYRPFADCGYLNYGMTQQNCGPWATIFVGMKDVGLRKATSHEVGTPVSMCYHPMTWSGLPRLGHAFVGASVHGRITRVPSSGSVNHRYFAQPTLSVFNR